MDVNISAWLIISDVTRGKPQLSEWLIFQGVELFTAGRGYLLNAALGTGWRLSARSEWRRILCFFGDFICFWFLRCNFHFKERKIRKGQRTSGLFLFGLVCFSLTHPFFKVPNSDIECLVPGVKLRVRFFWLFLWYLWFSISLVYRNLVETLSENSREEILPRDQSKIRFVAHSRHCERERCWKARSPGLLPEGGHRRHTVSGLPSFSSCIWKSSNLG